MSDDGGGENDWNSNLRAWRQRRRKSQGLPAQDNEFQENADNSPRGILGKTTWSEMKNRKLSQDNLENDPLADIFDADGMSKSPRRPKNVEPRVFTVADAKQFQNQHTSVFNKERPSDVFNTRDLIKQQQNNVMTKKKSSEDDDFALFEKAEQTLHKKYGPLKETNQPVPTKEPPKPQKLAATSRIETHQYVPPMPKNYYEKKTPENTANKNFPKPVSENTKMEISPEDKQKQLINRKQKFASKFSMWENMAQQQQNQPTRPVSFNPHLNRTPSQSENLVMSETSKPKPVSKLEQNKPITSTSAPAKIKPETKLITPSQNSNIRSSSGVSVKSGVSSTNTNPINSFTGLRASSETPKRKMKIIIQQKPNLEGGFGFKLNIGPGRTILVENVVKRGSADKCGLKNGDEVDLINDHPCQVFSLRELDDIVKSAVYSGNISLMIQRKAEESKVDSDKENYGDAQYTFRPKIEPEEKINPFKSNSSLNSNSVQSNSLKQKNVVEEDIQNLENKLENVEINTSNNNESEEKWYRELGLYDTQNIQRIQTLDLRNNKVVTEDAQKIIEPILEKNDTPKIREKVSNNSGGSFYSSESGPTGSGGSTGDQKMMKLSPKNNFQEMDERFEESIRSEERELMKKRHQRELDEQRRRQEYEDKMEEEGRLRRMELEAKEAEQRARRNREKYDGQMQRIEQELKLEEAKLAQVRDQRVQAEQKLKQRYNYNQDYSVIHPGQKASKIHEVPDIPSPNLRSLHNTNNKSNNNNQPRYYFQENKIKSREPPQYQERTNHNNHDNNSGSVENILNDPSLQATLL